MTTNELPYLEALCKELYESSSSTDRVAAEKALADFIERQDCVQKCTLLIEQGSSAYSRLVGTTTLIKLVSRVTGGVGIEEKAELKDYLLRLLVDRYTEFPSFVVSALCQLFARLIKVSWLDIVKEKFEFQQPIETIIKLVESDRVQLCSLSILLLAHLTAEMNDSQGFELISRHRRIAASFRDNFLLEIFQLTVKLLRQALTGIANFNLSDETQRSLLIHLLQLAVNVLNYDFVGCVVEDSSDDITTVQVPTSWKSAIDSSLVALFFDLYKVLPLEFSAMVLGCIVQLTSIRRTIFNTVERTQYLLTLMNGVITIMEDPQRLGDLAVYHEFCRMIARLKSNFQLVELVKVENYVKILRLLTDFTVQSLQMHQFSTNSIHYLLTFWQRMVSSMPYVKSSEPHSLEQFVPLITKAYVQSRMNLVALVLRDGIEDPLEDCNTLHQQLELFSTIFRCEYSKTCQVLIQYFDQCAAAFEQSCSSSNEPERNTEDCRLTWLVYMIGSAIDGRLSCSTCEEHDLFDGDLVSRVLKLMRLTDTRSSNVRVSEKLELAYLWFLEQFRKVYVGDQIQRSTKVFMKLTETTGMIDEANMLSFFVQKIITNLKLYGNVPRLMEDSLNLLNELTSGYASIRRIVRLAEIQYLLKNHTASQFMFLSSDVDLKAMRVRTTFYSSITRIVCVDTPEDENYLEEFLTSFTDTIQRCSHLLAGPESSIANQETTKKLIIGLARDLRGIICSCTVKSSYAFVFEWMLPKCFEILRRSIEIWYSDPNVTSPVLKLIAELCQNRSGRLALDVSSPNSVLLFRECSKFCVAYGSRILSLTNLPTTQIYHLKLKGISICFAALRAALYGGYANFGIMHLYGDTSLDDVLNVSIKLIATVVRSDIVAYPKFSNNYFFLLESLTQDNMLFLTHVDSQVTVYVLETLLDGIASLDATICTSCCCSLDNFVTYLYKRATRGNKSRPIIPGFRSEGDNILRILEPSCGVLRRLLDAILNILTFDHCLCQWSMSRPLLGLILLQEQYFEQLKQNMVASFSVDLQQLLTKCFEHLMEDVERSLTTRNKDRFTQNVSTFRRFIGECLKSNVAFFSHNANGVGNTTCDMMA